MKKRWLHITLAILAFVLTILAIGGGAYFRIGLDVTEGMPSAERIRAPHVMENARETERNQQAALERAQMLEIVYTINPTEWQFVSHNLDTLQSDLYEIRTAYMLELKYFNQTFQNWEEEVEAHNANRERAMAEWDVMRIEANLAFMPPPPQPEFPELPPPPVFLEEALELFAGLHMMFSEEEQRLLVTVTDEHFLMLWEAISFVAATVQLEHQIDAINFITMLAVTRALSTLEGLDRAAEDLVENITLQHLRPNVIPDRERNRERFEESSNNYERVWIQAGQIIVDEGEIVTEEIYYLLGQFGMLRSDSIWENRVPMLAVIFLVAVFFVISIMYLTFYCPTMAASKKEAALLFTIFTLSLAIAWVLREFPVPVIALMIFPMLVSLLIDRRCAMVLTFIMVLICFFVVGGSLAYLLFYSTIGAAICLLSRFSTERNKVFLVGFVVMAVCFALSVIVTFIIVRGHAFSDFQGMFLTASLAAVSGMLTVIICTGSLPFWETFFGVVTPVKLLDLTNPTNLLLRRLTIEAPGTYHHSLIVANLAETAAYDIGANAHAARVGGYYHDVGKLKLPHYFAENLDGDNPHDHIDPINSAQIIISHVSYGLTLANEHRLPQFVRDIIREHHGTTMLQYFYVKAKESNPEVEDKDYRYPFVTPQTRESACVMLADSVEAAVRATMPKLNSVDEVEVTIRNIIRGKLNDGQLAESQLSIKDVTIIEQSFFRVLKGMYHERIAYPKASPPVVTKKKREGADA